MEQKKVRKFEQSHSAKKGGKSHSVKKIGKGDPSALEWFLSHVRGFGCIENEELGTYGKSA